MVRQRATGALFVTTDENRSAQVALQEGRIVYLYFGNKVGASALQRMGQINAGRYRFQEGVSGLPRMELPSNDEILGQLDSAVDGQGAVGSSPVSDTADTGAVLTERQKALLLECLVEFVGPIGEILCEDHFRQSCSLNKAIDLLASEIPSAAQAKRFRDMVLTKLGP
ncbi:DUF4388 domain-containing protein [Imhoffiella purpurea]|uniref:DUF4388 domain-containing protein n=1 Tax=Imhoffiella purpurea TaxID=1249627 RepID=UPI0012FE2F44|nr:DUF4388 domain-containing protein [Imhoffiella purpurea]